MLAPADQAVISPLSNLQLSQLLRCHFSTASRLRRGVYRPSLTMALALSEVFGLDVDALVGLTPDEQGVTLEKCFADWQARTGTPGQRVMEVTKGTDTRPLNKR